jgi:choice-of-anchor C domain-containing protein
MRTLKILAGAAVAATAILGATASNAAVAIVNGSFEDGAIDPGSFTTLSAGDTTITGWLVGGAGVDYIGTYWQASDGSRSIDLSALGAGSLSQILSGLTLGQTYQVSFDLAGNPDGGSSTKVAVVTDGETTSTYDFLLTFSSAEESPYGPALDNVSISGAVPEPATWAMMILGFGVVGASLRTRRRALAA